MDIRVGGVTPSGPPVDRSELSAGAVEARVLSVRAPRRHSAPPPPGAERRERHDAHRDPAGGRVMVLLIPEGYRLPEGLEQGTWRVFLRFARR